MVVRKFPITDIKIDGYPVSNKENISIVQDGA
jgi:hypothetical protein